MTSPADLVDRTSERSSGLTVAQARERRRLWAKRILPPALILLAAALVLATGWHRLLTLETLVRHRAEIATFVDNHFAASVAAFIGLYVAVVALSLPGATILTVGGGIVFGTAVAAAAAIVGATAGATILFLVARTAAGEFLTRRAGPLLGRLADGFRENAFSYLLFLRLVPVFPFWLVNLAPALFGVGPGVFVGATAIGIIPGTLAFAFVGSGLDSVIVAQESAYRNCLAGGGSDCRLDFDPASAVTPEMLAAFAALGVVALLPVAVKQWRARRQAK